jgi:hypothetical protein
LTGYSGRDLLFGPAVYEYYQTVSYVGLQHGFGSRIRATAAVEFLRAWRVQTNQFAIAQTLRPRFGVDLQFKEHWTMSASGAWSSGRGFHAYDNVNSRIMFSYTNERNLNRTIGSEPASVGYPLRFSFGLEQQSFYDFPGHGGNKIVPAAQFTF